MGTPSALARRTLALCSTMCGMFFLVSSSCENWEHFRRRSRFAFLVHPASSSPPDHASGWRECKATQTCSGRGILTFFDLQVIITRNSSKSISPSPSKSTSATISITSSADVSSPTSFGTAPTPPCGWPRSCLHRTVESLSELLYFRFVEVVQLPLHNGLGARGASRGAGWHSTHSRNCGGVGALENARVGVSVWGCRATVWHV
jgi:hypothetical protein